jgi:hypothetical protein
VAPSLHEDPSMADTDSDTDSLCSVGSGTDMHNYSEQGRDWRIRLPPRPPDPVLPPDPPLWTAGNLRGKRAEYAWYRYRYLLTSKRATALEIGGLCIGHRLYRRVCGVVPIWAQRGREQALYDRILPLPGSLMPEDVGVAVPGCAACICASPALYLLSWNGDAPSVVAPSPPARSRATSLPLASRAEAPPLSTRRRFSYSFDIDEWEDAPNSNSELASPTSGDPPPPQFLTWSPSRAMPLPHTPCIEAPPLPLQPRETLPSPHFDVTTDTPSSDLESTDSDSDSHDYDGYNDYDAYI